MLQNIRLQRNGRQSPKSDDDMNGSCVKTCQEGENHGFVELFYKFQGFQDRRSWCIVELIYKLPSP